MITINSCSDLDAHGTCQRVVEYASQLNANLLLAIEPIQWRGQVPIARPHAHLLVALDRKAAKRIADHFMKQALDVDVTWMYYPRGACWYVGMTPGSIHYFNRRKETPLPAPQEAGKADVSVSEEDNYSTQHRSTIVIECARKEPENGSIAPIHVHVRPKSMRFVPEPSLYAALLVMTRAP